MKSINEMPGGRKPLASRKVISPCDMPPGTSVMYWSDGTGRVPAPGAASRPSGSNSMTAEELLWSVDYGQPQTRAISAQFSRQPCNPHEPWTKTYFESMLNSVLDVLVCSTSHVKFRGAGIR